MSRYHYTECGLDNVWLDSGFEVERFGEYGTAVAVHDEKGLQRLLAREIVGQDSHLVGQELRFLRTQLDWTQTELGKRLGYGDGQMVAKWEKARHKAIPVHADVIVRAAYREEFGEKPMVTRVSQRLAEIVGVVAEGCRRIFAAGPMGQWTTQEGPPRMALA